MFKVFEAGLPRFLAHHMCSYASTRALRSSASKLLEVLHTILQFGSCSSRISAPTLWNSLPHIVHFCESLATFQKHLKTFYFQAPQIQFLILALYKFIYLLTYSLHPEDFSH